MSIVQFKPKQDLGCLCCTHCERQDWWLLEDGSIQCRGCQLVSAYHRHYSKLEAKLVPLDEH